MEAARDDGFKWFGEGFDGFPRSMPEGCIEYMVFALEPGAGGIIGLPAKLESMRTFVVDLASKLLGDYIWQQEEFALQLVTEHDTRFLRGRTSFGDAIEDEWVIVYLLRELSKAFSDAWIRLFDTDGEFLLIEAADALPRWLTPDNSENRVWINSGHLKMIPLPEQAGSQKTKAKSHGLSMKDAHQHLRTGPFYQDGRIEDDAFRRLQDYPEKVTTNQHHALLRIPRRLALVLREFPKSVSLAVDAFYLRDPIAIRPLRAPGNGALQFPAQDLVVMRTKFNRVGFAQLRSQHFDRPQTWTEVAPVANPSLHSQTETGMKLTSGFEMLLGDPQNRSQAIVQDMKVFLKAVDTGHRRLPGDEELAEMGDVADDEGWMDVNFQDLEKELRGDVKDGPLDGFGDQHALGNLRRMAARLETLLGDATTESGADEDKELDSASESSDSTDSEGQKAGSNGQPESSQQTDNEDMSGLEALAAAMEAELRQSGALEA